MADYVLWKQLTRTDYNSMHGLAAPAGTGGGARHIALGVATKRFPIDHFLRIAGRGRLSVQAESDGFGPGELRFVSIPGRRHGEWMIADQHSHRHPAWTANAGFPPQYDGSNPPIILVFRVGGEFYARLSNARTLARLFAEFRGSSARKGIAPVSDTLRSAFHIPPARLLTSYEEYLTGTGAPTFDPSSMNDGRERVFAAITRRQGQGPFRNALIDAYSGCCAITRTRTLWVLEAAHVVPYRGRQTNVVQNGLLLRADIHTLFDFGLISVEPRQRRIVVSRLLREPSYRDLQGRPLLQPRPRSARPTMEALAYHYDRFRG